MVKNTCPLCNQANLSDFLVREQVPVHQNLPFASQVEARSIAKGDLVLAICEDCGFVFNRAFDSSKLSYGSSYDNNQAHSSVFVDYVSSLARQLTIEQNVRNSTIVEVGCGQGEFLRQLVEPAALGNRGYGFDPSYQGADQELDGRVQFRRCYYDADCTDIIADVVVCRHVIEHVDEPLPMLASIRQALAGSKQARVFFETPCVDWIIDHQVVWDFFYEHCSYFNATSLAAAFEISGFQVIDVHHVFSGQFLWLEAQLKDDRGTDLRGAVEKIQQAREFGHAVQQLEQDWHNKIQALSQQGKVAIWGAGAKGVTLANLIDPDAQLIDALIDLNPNKCGKYTPGSGHPIVNYLDVADREITAAILTNPHYYNENIVLLEKANLSLALVV
jgi:SAM-dependent methyltransferase